jgi:hypothetical protein
MIESWQMKHTTQKQNKGSKKIKKNNKKNKEIENNRKKNNQMK